MDKEALLKILQTELPHHLVRKFGSNLQVRKGVITFQSIEIVFNESRQSAKVTSMVDYLGVFMMLMFPIGLYIYFNRAKYIKLKHEVIQILRAHNIVIE